MLGEQLANLILSNFAIIYIDKKYSCLSYEAKAINFLLGLLPTLTYILSWHVNHWLNFCIASALCSLFIVMLYKEGFLVVLLLHHAQSQVFQNPIVDSDFGQIEGTVIIA